MQTEVINGSNFSMQTESLQTIQEMREVEKGDENKIEDIEMGTLTKQTSGGSKNTQKSTIIC